MTRSNQETLLKKQNQHEINILTVELNSLLQKARKNNREKTRITELQAKLKALVQSANADFAKISREDDHVVDVKVFNGINECKRELHTCRINYAKSMSLLDQLAKNVEAAFKPFGEFKRSLKSKKTHIAYPSPAVNKINTNIAYPSIYVYPVE